MSLIAACLGPEGSEIACDSYMGDKFIQYPGGTKIAEGVGFLYGVTGNYRIFDAAQKAIEHFKNNKHHKYISAQSFAITLSNYLYNNDMLAHKDGVGVMSLNPESNILYINKDSIWQIHNDFSCFKIERDFHAIGMHIAAGFAMGYMTYAGKHKSRLAWLAAHNAIPYAPFLSEPVYHLLLPKNQI
jgi:hypothetical protein